MEHTRSGQPPAHIAVRDNTVEGRFELFVDGAPAGLLSYEHRGDDYVLTHTEIDEDFEGRGMGSALVGGALDQIRNSKHGVLPHCPFVRAYLQRHAEFLPLVPAGYRADYGLPVDADPAARSESA